MFDKKIFGIRLKKLRKDKKLSQDKIAELLRVTRTQISDLENGKTTTSIERLNQLVDFFDVPIDYLLCRGVFSNWEQVMEYKDIIIKTLEESSESFKILSLYNADEKLLMHFFYTLFAKIDIEENPTNVILYPTIQLDSFKKLLDDK